MAKSAEDIVHKLNECVLRALDNTAGPESDIAIGLARQLLTSNDVHQDSFKLVVVNGHDEKSNEELLRLYREARVSQTVSDLQRTVAELQGRIDELTAQSSEKDQKLAEFTASLQTIQPTIATTPKEWGALKTQDAYQHACRLHIDEGKSAHETARIMGLLYRTGHGRPGQPRTGILDGMINNRPPNEGLLGHTIQVLEAGQPMDFYELWKIGYNLYGDKWRKTIAAQFNTKAIGRRAPVELLSQEQMDQLRLAYQTLIRVR